MSFHRFFSGFSLLLLLAGCSAFPLRTGSPTSTHSASIPVKTPVPATSPAITPAQAITSAPAFTSTPATVPASTTPGQAKGPLTLHIWVPPQFDPTSGTIEGSLLNQRLEEFKNRRPGIQLDVRVKAMEGPGGLLDTLSTASAAAPGVLPDLVALPRPMMEAAALKGLLHPYDGLSTILDSTDWYTYAQQLAHLQKSTFGLPFAGDALILMYRPSVVGDPPRMLGDIQNLKGLLSFPASDPESLFTLTLYQAAGGDIQDMQGRPSLDPIILSQVLSFYQKAAQAGLAPTWLSQYETDDQSWSAFVEGKANLAVTWASRYLMESGDQLKDTAAVTLPTLDGTRYTLATGWVWALAGSQNQNQAAAVQLAEFLIEADYMARWTAAAGFLPTRASSLSAWPDSPMRSLASQVMLSAHPYPPVDVLSSLSPALRQATMQILNNQGEPLFIAQEAASQLKSP